MIKNMEHAGKMCVSLFISLALSGSLLPGTGMGASIVINPSSAWCTAINSALPGDDIVFAPGSYTTPCWITANGLPGAPVMVRSQSEEPNQRATFAYPGSTSNVLELRNAAYLTIRGFSFAPTQDGIDAIRIRKANDIIIERNFFQRIGGVSISANDSDTQRITVRQNTFKDLKYTGLYFGCHDGSACHTIDVLIEGNLIDGITTPFDPSAIGYGLEIKLNSYGTVRDNTIYRTKGPGIMVYGSNRMDPPSIVEGNYVEGSKTEGGIVIGGGPAIVRNNVLIGNAYGGISAQNYGGRNLQKNVWIVHNTILNNADSSVNVQGWYSGSGNVIAHNAILPLPGNSAVRPSSPPGTVVRNITCESSCFVNSIKAPYDLWPSPNSPILDAAGSGTEVWRPMDDFMGVSRGSAADIGAFERTPITIDHLVGGGNPRPARISTEVIPVLQPTNPPIQK
jgi:hypothetical protein